MFGDKYFEDFEVGEEYGSDGFTITESQIMDFALEWDPQFFHLDRSRADENELLGGFCASGWHTLVVTMRMAFQSGLFWPGVRGGRSAREMHWLRPVRPDDTLHCVTEVIETTPIEKRPDYGMVVLRHTAIDQDDHKVFTITIEHIFARRTTQIA